MKFFFLCFICKKNNRKSRPASEWEGIRRNFSARPATAAAATTMKKESERAGNKQWKGTRKRSSRKKSCKKFNFFSFFLLHFLCCFSIASHRRHRDFYKLSRHPLKFNIKIFKISNRQSRGCKWSRNLFWMARRWRGKKRKESAKKLENVDENWWKEFTGANYTALCLCAETCFHSVCALSLLLSNAAAAYVLLSLFSFAAANS